MKLFKQLAAGTLSAAMAFSTAAVNLPNLSVTAATSDAVSVVEAMGLGWNLGNTFDSSITWSGTEITVENLEKAWGNPTTTEAMIKEIKKAGFNSVRIPVTWSQMMDSDGHPNTDWLARIKEVVDYCVNNGMYAIINTHHDEYIAGRLTDSSRNWINGDSSAVQTKFATLWTDIANYFKDYDQHLVFEGMNEEEIGNSAMMTLNQLFVDTVRATGGNNATRLLLVEADANNTEKALSSDFSAPTDSANMIAVSVHYYEPTAFCVSEDPSNSSWYQSSWGTNSDYTKLEKDLDALQTKFIDNGIPVIIGEYGVVNKTSAKKDAASSKAFVKEVASYAYNKTGMCPVLWDMSVQGSVGTSDEGDMYYFDRTTLSWYDEDYRDIFVDIAGGVSNNDKTQTDRVTYSAADCLDEEGHFVIDLEPYRGLGVTVTSVIVNYTISSTDSSLDHYGAGVAVTYNTYDPETDDYPWNSDIGYPSEADTMFTVELSNSADLDMDYLNLQTWWTWSDPEGSEDTVTFTYGDVTIIFDGYVVVDDIGSSTTEPGTTTVPEPTVVWGDADDNGAFELADCVWLAKCMGNVEGCELSVAGIQNADLCTDEGITSNDMKYMLQYYGGLIGKDSLPVSK